MIDAKKIVEAAILNADKYNPFRSTLDREEVCRASFEDGAEWFKQAIWHDAKEKPEEYKCILVQWLYKGRISHETDTIERKDDWQYIVKTFNVTKWCYIDDILPKGGEK